MSIELVSSHDANNFEIKITDWVIVMTDGELEINGISYEHDADNPTYDLVRELWRQAK